MSAQIQELLSDEFVIRKLPDSECRNCQKGLRLFKGRWYHVEMSGGEFYAPTGCKRPWPMRCKKCGARLDYKTLEPMYYDYECQRCIEQRHKGERIGTLTDELKRQLNAGTHPYLKYGTSCAVVLTENGFFFEDIC